MSTRGTMQAVAAATTHNVLHREVQRQYLEGSACRDDLVEDLDRTSSAAARQMQHMSLGQPGGGYGSQPPAGPSPTPPPHNYPPPAYQVRCT